MQGSFNVGINFKYHDQFHYLPKRWKMSNGIQINLLPLDNYALENGLFYSDFDIENSPYDLLIQPAPFSACISPAPGLVSLQMHSKLAQLHALTRIKNILNDTPNRIRKVSSLFDPDTLALKFIVPRYTGLIHRDESTATKRNLVNVSRLSGAKGLLVRSNFGSCGTAIVPLEFKQLPTQPSELHNSEWLRPLVGDQFDYFVERGYHIVECVENIRAEYRILRLPSNEFYICKRERQENEYGALIARVPITGEKTAEQYIPFETCLETEAIREEVVNIIKALDKYQRFGSYDLFVTEDGSFGFFEFATQFALNGMCNNLRVEVMRTYIERLVIEALDERLDICNGIVDSTYMQTEDTAVTAEL